MHGKFVALQLYGPLLARDKPSITRLVLTLIVLVVVMITIMTTMKRKSLVCDMNHIWILAVACSHEMFSDMKLLSDNWCI
jgi:hypothetical protein